MAKLIKKTNMKGDAINYMKARIRKYNSAYETLKHLFDEKVEQVYMIIFSGDKAVNLINVSKGAGGKTDVEIDMGKVQDILAKIDGTGLSYAMSHNHPYMTDKDGNWIETLVSDNDVLSTALITSNQALEYPDIEYEGHFVVNKEMNEELKIIYFNDTIGFKFTKEIIQQAKAGEL